MLRTLEGERKLVKTVRADRRPNYLELMKRTIEVLHLEASFLGTAHVIGWFSLMLGTYIYNRYFKHMKLRNISYVVVNSGVRAFHLLSFVSRLRQVQVVLMSYYISYLLNSMVD